MFLNEGHPLVNQSGDKNGGVLHVQLSGTGNVPKVMNNSIIISDALLWMTVKAAYTFAWNDYAHMVKSGVDPRVNFDPPLLWT